MLASERQQKIKEYIVEKKFLKISELSKRFDVSEMTIHRDIKPLIKEGLIEKTFGGISLKEQKEKVVGSQEHCLLCGRQIQPRFSYRLILKNHEIEHTCCSHCGLMRHHQRKEDVLQAICSDFLFLTTIPATSAFYVMDTTIECACCKPQVLTFETRENADKFVRGFGGSVYSFEEATNQLLKRMNMMGSCYKKHD